MKARIIVLFLLLVPIVSIFYSCCNCYNVVTDDRGYSHKALSLKLLDNSGAAVIESEALQLNKNAFGIRLYLTRVGCEECGENIISQNIKQLSTIFTPSAFAFACDCPPDFAYLPLERIESIKIFTLNNFDSTHPEGSDITDYFRSAGGSFQKVESLVSSLYYDWAMQLPSDLKIDLLLMVAPTTDNKLQLKIEVALSDGRILEQQTPEIKLL